MPSEVESNDTRNQATLIPTSEFVSGRLSSSGDIDWFAVQLSSIGVVNLTRSFSSGAETLTVYDSAGTIIAKTASSIAFETLAAGTYYIEVRSQDNSPVSGSDYSLYVGDLPPNATIYANILSAEPNNTLATAVPMPLGSIRPTFYQLSTLDDQDWFSLDLPDGPGSAGMLTIDIESAGDHSYGLRSVEVVIDGVSQDLAFGNLGGLLVDVRDGAPIHLNFHITGTTLWTFDYIEFGVRVNFHPYRDTQTAAASTSPPTDGRFGEQWYLSSAGINVLPVWQDYTGDGVTIALIGDGIDPTHADLDASYTGAFSYYSGGVESNGGTYPYVIPLYGGDPRTASETYTTSIAGLVAAERNGQGIVGVAYNAELGSVYLPVTSSTFNMNPELQLAAQADIALVPSFYPYPTSLNPFFSDILDTRFMPGRDGLGTVIVTGAKDHALEGGNTNDEQLTNDRRVITVAATDQNGVVAAYSAPGSSILVSAPGGTSQSGLLTTDRAGAAGVSAGDYTTVFGTDFAAALVGGVVALMLEANPDLGYRDVQQILALTATATDGSTGWQLNGASHWNGGGLLYSEDYGYGMVDARAAVRLAESWTRQSTAGNQALLTATSTQQAAIPDMGPAVSTSLTLGALNVERVEINLDISHGWIGDLVVDLTSAAGTVATLLATPGGGGANNIYLSSFPFGSAAFLGENAAGTWTISVRDVVAQDAGVLNGWTIRAYGSAVSADDTYIYTDEYGSLADATSDGSRRSLNDGNGGHDIINAAALTASATINLAGGPSAIAGQELNIAAGVVEDVYGGDGDDIFTGNALANLFKGGRGNDIFYVSAGADTLDGGDGVDRVCFVPDSLAVSVALSATGSATVGGPGGSGITLISIEALVGTNSNDTLIGGAGNEFLNGGSGDDLLQGGDGNDTIIGGFGHDTLDGGDGFDVLAFNLPVGPGELPDVVTGFEAIWGSGSHDVIIGWATDDQISAGFGNDSVDGAAGNDYLAGEQGNDTLSGGDGQDWLWAGSGNDVLDGGAEKDNLNGEAGDDVIDGGAGNDRITGRDGNDTIHAGTGNDWVGVWNDWGEQPELNYFPEWGDDQIFGDEGNDVLSAGFGRDTVHGGTGDDYVAGEQDDDLLYGDEGYDWLWAGAGNDTLDGGTEKDNLNGESGNDLIHGGDGNDRICGQQDDDEIHAGAGNDWVGVWNDWGEDPALNYFPEAGNDLIHGDAGNDVLSAGFGRDTVHGGADDDYVAGEQEDDVLYGDAGTDWLWGGAGDDILTGGDGADVLIGESGADRFVYTALSELGDRIVDFDGAAGDVIDVSALLDAAGYGGTDPFADLRLSFAASGTDVLFRFDGSLIATLENNTLAQLQTSYFIV